jgi:hypothetical protein
MSKCILSLVLSEAVAKREDEREDDRKVLQLTKSGGIDSGSYLPYAAHMREAEKLDTGLDGIVS